MCGIFGIILKSGAPIVPDHLSNLLKNLYIYSENRGKESSGMHVYLPKSGDAWTLKGENSASNLLKSKAFKQIIHASLSKAYEAPKQELTQPLEIFGHSRLVTNGSASIHLNNQPVQSGQITMIHNGIIVNAEHLWSESSHLHRLADVDTEIMAAMLDDYLKNDFNYARATKQVFEKIRGTASLAWTHDQSESVVLATNTGDIFYYFLPDEQGIIFASEQYILEQSLKKIIATSPSIQGLPAGHGLIYSTHPAVKPVFFELLNDEKRNDCDVRLARPIQTKLFLVEQRNKSKRLEILTPHHDYSLLKYKAETLRALKRCSQCILPETFPFIKFDEAGLCNYCKNYRPRYAQMHPLHTKQAFIASLEKYKRKTNRPDVLVPFSGGRDSSYGLHLICKEFGLKPITFTYDWGMVTDLARRNVARMCGQLGVQNILVSADIAMKRKNIRNNVAAWLNKPELGMVPLFMAGDKAFFTIVNQLKKQTGIHLNLWCANPLENTDFKSGFCGVSPDFEKTRLDYLSMARKLKMVKYFLNHFMLNPRYINASLVDTFKAFLSYYFEPREDFYFIFDHFIWNESEVNQVLLTEYDWETSPDSSSTWRIGDGTAPFYNYIYSTAHGFTEFDTFRSNQIREGALSRDAALELVLVENRPREESLQWYFQTIGLDFNAAINKINQLDKRHLHH